MPSRSRHINHTFIVESSNDYNFCRAMLCLSATYAVARCLSVCLCILLKRINILYSTFFHRRLATPLPVFLYQTLWQYSDGDLPTTTSNAGGVGKNRDPRPVSGFIACRQRFDRQVLYTQLRLTVASWWHLSLVNGVVCFSREMTTKCLWQEASTLQYAKDNRTEFNCTRCYNMKPQ